MDNQILCKLQQCETEILFEFDSFCEKHQLKYSLYAGTALGAVRHQGFIPWDDDIDVCMTREDYDRFTELWKKESPVGYYLQDPADDSSTINHMKIRKDNTILASKKEMKSPGHHGIWIDIFPMDKIPKNTILRKVLLFFAKLRLVYTRGYVMEKGGTLLKIISYLMLLIPRKVQVAVRKKCDNYVTRYNKSVRGFDLMSFSSPSGLQIVFPAEMLNHTHKVKFGDYMFQLTDMYDEMLRLEFGDYMKLPPEEERICKHTPEIIEFENDD